MFAMLILMVSGCSVDGCTSDKPVVVEPPTQPVENDSDNGLDLFGEDPAITPPSLS